MSETTKQRSQIMRAVRSKDTTPEMIVRRISHSLGFRHRLHKKDLPGQPDLVYTSLKKIINVHGCFWHGHDCKRGARVPKNNRDYWLSKIQRNRERDIRNRMALEELGWSILTIWECEIRDASRLKAKISQFLIRE